MCVHGFSIWSTASGGSVWGKNVKNNHYFSLLKKHLVTIMVWYLSVKIKYYRMQTNTHKQNPEPRQEYQSVCVNTITRRAGRSFSTDSPQKPMQILCVKTIRSFLTDVCVFKREREVCVCVCLRSLIFRSFTGISVLYVFTLDKCLCLYESRSSELN